MSRLTRCRLSTYDSAVRRLMSPMREPTYFVLAALLAGPLHGYAIMKRAEELSGGRVRLATGTLYTALDRLAADGYVRLVSEEMVNGRIRRSYGLTDEGSAALRAEAQRMAEAAQLVTGETALRRPASPRRAGRCVPDCSAASRRATHRAARGATLTRSVPANDCIRGGAAG
jgi:PadR family transcriptional regulator, regulatory protein PadR